MSSPPQDLHASELHNRLRQQQLIAHFGLFVLRQDEVQPLLDEVCRVAAEGMQDHYAKILTYLPDEHAFLLQSGVGWSPDEIGRVRLGAETESPAGYAFKTGDPVISNELATESRFRTPPILVKHGINRAINVIVRGEGEAFGVLEVDRRDAGDFSQPDIAYLQALANTLAVAIEKRQSQVALQQSEAFARSVLEASTDCINVLDLEGRLQFMNANGLFLMEVDELEALQGSPWADLWPAEQAEQIRRIVAAAAQGEPGHFESFGPTAKGTPKWWDVSVVPVADTTGRPGRLVAVSRDVTARRRSEMALAEASAMKDSLLREKDLLMQEVHHRVKNSLQLVQTLLQLQARTLAEPEARLQLQEAAQRVLTIGAVHRRLYQGGSVVESNAASYLEGLLADLRTSLTDQAEGRSIELAAEPIMLAADHLTPLGLITTEFVTNALKYGQGRVTVGVRRVDSCLEITVEDEGEGFSPEFDPVRSGGLGMRLVIALAKGDGRAIRIDRSVPHSRVVARLQV
ncbi:MAG: PAS domain-containing protein [Acidisphaera sp.]|nr:PAS domain-containing protein [Acidisphaera sp.]